MTLASASSSFSFAAIELRQPQLDEVGRNPVRSLRISSSDDTVSDIQAKLQLEWCRVPPIWSTGRHEPSPIEARTAHQFFRVPWSSPGIHSQTHSTGHPRPVARRRSHNGLMGNRQYAAARTSGEKLFSVFAFDGSTSLMLKRPATAAVHTCSFDIPIICASDQAVVLETSPTKATACRSDDVR